MDNENTKTPDEIREISDEKGASQADLSGVALLKDELLPDEIDSLPLEKSAVMLVNNIINTDDIDDLKRFTKMFEINQAKKNAIRVIKLNNLLDKVNDQAIERFVKRPYEVSNKELLDYMQVVQSQIEKSQKSVDKINEAPMIQLNQQNNSINVNLGEDALDRESKEKVIDAVTLLLKSLKSPDSHSNIEEDIPQDVDILEEEKIEGEE